MTELRLIPILNEDGDIDERETCLNVWIFRGGRSSARTATIMAQEFGVEVKPNTITQWAKRGSWDQRAKELFHESAPVFYEKTAATLLGGAEDASRLLAAAARREPWTLDEKGSVDRGAVSSATTLLHMVGFLPNTRKEAERNGTPVSRSASNSDDAWTGMDEEELRQAIASRVKHSG